ALGPVDQHSQLQFYNEGTKMLSVLFLTVKNLQSDRIISEVSIPAISYLQNQSFGNILKIEYQSTALSLYNHDSPSATLQIDSLTPRTVGTLFLFFELAVVYLAKMLSVNAFDQPGVEESKQLIFKALGRV
ncbi:MAG: glucose-6-phosphate isomerase, partial [Microgenomates group bacterium]